MAAEAGLLIGMVAAAAQFSEVGCRLLLRTSTLYSRFQNVPQSLQRMRNQIRLLLQLADRVSQKNMPQFLHQVTFAVSQSQPTHDSVSLSWQENVWKICTAHAQDLENVTTAMLCESEDSRVRRIWKKVLTLKREEKIYQIMNEIEGYKSMLSVWYGQECLDTIHTIRQGIVDIQTAQMANLVNEVKAMRLDMKTLSKSRLQPTPCGSLIQNKQSLQQQCSSLRRDRSTTMMLGSSFDETGTFRGSTNSCFRCMLMDQKNVFCYQDSRISLRYSAVMRGHCPVHLRSSSVSEIDTRLRIWISWYLAIEIAVFLRWESRKPSFGLSLRAETRVRDLALEPFFRGLYKTRLWERIVIGTTPRGWQITKQVPVSTEKQNYLFSVARKMLIQTYQRRTASPYDVNSRGQTLLHTERSPNGLETFRVQVIRLLLSMGLKADTPDDNFRTAQQGFVELGTPSIWSSSAFVPGLNSQISHTLIEWAPGPLSGLRCAIEILDCALRWPESISDCEYPQICNIVIRRSIDDLASYISRSLHLKERTSLQLQPLHFAAALNWSQGTEFLLAHGADRYAEDSCKHSALDIAIKTKSADVVEILLKGDCSPYLGRETICQSETRPYNLLTRGLHGNEMLQNVVVKALARLRPQAKRLYHDLAYNHKDGSAIARKLFAAGFDDIEGHDKDGMTPLIRACSTDNTSLAAFFLEKGADAATTHRDAALTAGHFLSFEAERFWGNKSYASERENGLDPEEEAKLLQCAFDIAGCVDSRCRCSPEGFSPITSTFKADEIEHSFVRWQNLGSLYRRLNLSQADIRKHWRSFVRMEIFDRLELTHTCIRHIPTVRTFPEEDRLEIEDEEEELNLQLEALMEEYDDWEQSFHGDIVNCVDTFCDRLDQDLRPRGGLYFLSRLWEENDSDILGPGETFENHWLSSRGDRIYEDHREGIRESYMLRSLFS